MTPGNILRRAARAAEHVLFVALALLMRLVRPLALVRVGKVATGRIGHFAADCELYLCQRELGLAPKRCIDLFHPEEFVSNQAMLAMLRRKMTIHPLFRKLDEANRTLPGWERHTVDIFRKSRDVECLLSRTTARTSFTPEEEAQGRQTLQKLGVPHDSPFIALYGRDSAYLASTFPSWDWSYHDYRDMDVADFKPCAAALAQEGYHVVRMGSQVKEPLEHESPKVVDYATSGHRDEFSDIYLSAKCRFFIGVPGGIVALPMIHRVPTLYVNFIPLEYIQAWNPYDMFIPKKLWCEKKERLLTFGEILGSGLGRQLKSEAYVGNGVRVVNNSPEELRDAALEMDQRMKGSWEDTPEDQEMQRAFWGLFKASELNACFNARIASSFLRANTELVR